MAAVRRIYIFMGDDIPQHLINVWSQIGAGILREKQLRISPRTKSGQLKIKTRGSDVGLTTKPKVYEPDWSTEGEGFPSVLLSTPISAKLGEEMVEVVLGSFENADELSTALRDGLISGLNPKDSPAGSSPFDWNNVLIFMDRDYQPHNGIKVANNLRAEGITPKFRLHTTTPLEPGESAAYDHFMPSTTEPLNAHKCSDSGAFKAAIEAAFKAPLSPKVSAKSKARERASTHDGTKTPPPSNGGGGSGMGVAAPASAADSRPAPDSAPPAMAAPSDLPPRPGQPRRVPSLVGNLLPADGPGTGRSTGTLSVTAVDADLTPSRPNSPASAYSHVRLHAPRSGSSPLAKEAAVQAQATEKKADGTGNAKHPNALDPMASSATAGPPSRPPSSRTEAPATSFWNCWRCCRKEPVAAARYTDPTSGAPKEPS